MSSFRRPAAAIGGLCVIFGAVLLASESVLAGNPEQATLIAPAAAYPTQQIMLLGSDYQQCSLGPGASSSPSASPPGPVPEPTGSGGFGGIGLGGRVGAFLDGRNLGGRVEPDATGRIALRIMMPAHIAAGVHALATRCENARGHVLTGNVATASIQVPKPPSLVLSEGEDPPGKKVTITGRGFALCSYSAGEYQPVLVPVQLSLAGKPLVVAWGGQFSTAVTVPDIPPGPYTVAAECISTPRLASFAFGIVARASLRITATPPDNVGSAGAGNQSGSGGSTAPKRPPATSSPKTSATSPGGAKRPPGSKRPRNSLRLSAWAIFGFGGGLIIVLIALLALGARSRRTPDSRRRSLARNPMVIFTGYERTGPSAHLSHGRGGVPLAIGIQVRPDYPQV